MSVKLKYALAWITLLLVVAAAAAVVITPAWLIQPFAPQTARGIAISYYFKSWSPVITIVFIVAAALLAIYIWKRSRWYSKAPLVLPFALLILFAWFARQNHFEWMFNPLHQTNFAKVSDVDFVKDDEMVLAVNVNGDAVAFPIRQMAYHHVAQDVVGGTPITATY
jgi:uncharacterized protein DUF3179